jgi:hypothetical protein
VWNYIRKAGFEFENFSLSKSIKKKSFFLSSSLKKTQMAKEAD